MSGITRQRTVSLGLALVLALGVLFGIAPGARAANPLQFVWDALEAKAELLGRDLLPSDIVGFFANYDGAAITAAMLASGMSQEAQDALKALEEYYDAAREQILDDNGQPLMPGASFESEVESDAKELFPNLTESKVEVAGVGFQAVLLSAATLQLNFSKPDTLAPLTGAAGGVTYDVDSAVQVDIKLLANGTEYTNTLQMPLVITMPIPTGIDPAKLVILHYHAGSATPEVIVPKDNGDGTCAFIVSKFSVFVFVNGKAAAAASAAAGARISSHLPPVVPIIYDVVKTGDDFTFKTIIANGYGTGSMAGATATITLNDKYSTVVTIGQDGIGRGTISAPGFSGSMAAFSGRVNGSSGGVVNQFMTVRSDGTVVRA